MAQSTPSKSGQGSDKAASAGSGSSKRPTLKSLREHVDMIESRLNKADSLTRDSVKSLETAFQALEKRLGEDADVNHTLLSRRVDQISRQLTERIDTARQSISNDLAKALDNPDIDQLGQALKRAMSRLDTAELKQAEALTRVNKHIADLARAIDDQLREDAAAQDQKMATVKREVISLADKIETQTGQLALQLNKIEKDTASALKGVGEKVVAITQSQQQRQNDAMSRLEHQINAAEKSAHQSVESSRMKLERRMENLEEIQKNLDSYIERSVNKLTDRMEALEYGLSSAMPQTPPEQTIAAPLAAPAPEQAFEPSEPPVSLPDPGPVPDAGQTRQAQADPAPAQEPPSAPPQSGPAEPVEFIPPALQPGPAANPPTSNVHHLEPAADPYQPAEDAERFSPFGSQTGQAAPGTAPDPAYTPDDLPYENPAYAETDSGNRPGGVGLGEGRKFPLSGRNLRVLGLAVCVAALGFVALRSFGFGTGPETNLNAANMSGTSLPSGGQAPIALPQRDIETQPALGEYADNQGITDLNADELTTLEAAANAGNAIAEFQLGLNYVDSGRTEEGVALIRSAANKNQPAAQYRLAKFYESGIGVSPDPNMARVLTERAALNGNRIAMHDLALYYAEGRGGVDMDIARAANWFEKAAERGVVDSQFNLGVLYESGQGLTKDLKTAYVWYSIAAAQGDQFAKERLGVLETQLASPDIEDAKAQVENFRPARIDEAANGVFRNVPWNSPNAESGPVTPAMIQTAQQRLAALGYDAGTADGEMGPKTRSAIISFERKNGLPETGEVSASLLSRLDEEPGA